MPKIMCDAILCRHNAGNMDGKHPEMGMFECKAPEVQYRNSNEKCIDCGISHDNMDCVTYEKLSKRGPKV